MLRNSVDHGIESGAVREDCGKPSVGTVKLSAFHRSGHVVIEISDDGKGLDRERILASAIGKGLIAKDARLTEQEIDNLLFLPGFSTAAEVTNLSGRGVGMDVVKTAITSMGGRVTIATEYGRGTTFSIILPLTLAVLDGMVVSVSEQTMVLPISGIVETIRPARKDVRSVGPQEDVILVRGSFVPVVPLGTALGFPSTDQDEQTYILVETESSGILALAVDGIWDQRQVVIKSLEGNYGTIPGVSAATILGDGKIALIVDVEAIAQLSASAGLSARSTEQGKVA
jgi:two-component system chemotaxis sensor kinase CheA